MKLYSTVVSIALATVLPLSAAVLLAGCGGGGSASAPSSVDYAGRGIALGSVRTGDLTLTVKSDNTVSGSLAIADPTRALFRAPLSGAVSGSHFEVSGIYRDGSDEIPVRVTGTLPARAGETGGAITLTLQGASFSGVFGARPTPSPTPTPAPAATIDDFFPEPAVGDALTYARRETTTLTLNGVAQPARQRTSTYTTAGTTLLGSERRGARTTVDLGSVTVIREETLDSDGAPTGYLYYTQDAGGYRIYRGDTVARGALISTARYTPPQRLRTDLSPGQSDAQTYTVTAIDESGVHTYQESQTIQFVSASEAVTVAAGAFSGCAHLRFQSSHTWTEAGSTVVFSSDQNAWYARGIGAVQYAGTIDLDSGPAFRSRTESLAALQSARTGGKNYP